jgi:hypothetical protein
MSRTSTLDFKELLYLGIVLAPLWPDSSGP